MRAANSATRCRTPTARPSTIPICSSLCVIGDGEAETGPLAASWHSNKFLNPARDGAVLPILHLNGYKIANPTVLARIPHDELTALLSGYGYEPYFVEGDDPRIMHQQMAATLDDVHSTRSTRSSGRARAEARSARPRWPMIVLRTPKGWTGPKDVDGLPVEGTWRSHQVPLAEIADRRTHLRLLEDLAAELPARGTLRRQRRDCVPDLPALPPRGDRRMSANPHANGGSLLRDLETARLPRLRRRGRRARRSRRRGRPGCSAACCAT